MKVYHGSEYIIKKPLYKGSVGTNDYGPAFYTTEDLFQAKLWSCKKDKIGFVNEYVTNIDVLNILDLTDRNKYSILNWIAILIHYRKLPRKIEIEYKIFLDWLNQYYIDVEQYDVVIGYRADDNYFKFPLYFISNRLSLERLEKVYLAGNLGTQIVFISEKSIKKICFKKAIKPEKNYFYEYDMMVEDANNKLQSLLNAPIDPYEHMIIDLVRGSKND